MSGVVVFLSNLIFELLYSSFSTKHLAVECLRDGKRLIIELLWFLYPSLLTFPLMTPEPPIPARPFHQILVVPACSGGRMR